MTRKEKCIIIEKYLDEILPNPGCELTYNSDYGFLIAVSIEEIENNIKSLGLYKNKAKNLKGIAHELLTRFNGKVPQDKNELMSLPGVGNKTANVVRVELFKIPEFPVDTHVERLAKRFKLADKSDDVLTVENKLKKDFKKENWIKLHHQFIHFGRYYCKAISPKCDGCKLAGICTKNF